MPRKQKPSRMALLFDKLARVRIGHQAIMMQDAQAVLKQNRRGVEKHTNAEADEVGDIFLGDIQISNEDKSRKDGGKGSGLAKMALGAALVASGAGAVHGIPLLLSGGRDVIENTDNEKVRYLLDLGGGEEIATGEGNPE